MAKYIDADRLRAEIERLKEGVGIGLSEYEAGYHNGAGEVCNEILSVINSLQQEQPEVDLEKEIKSWIQTHVKGDDFEPYRTIKKKVIEWGEFVAHRFYELGKLHQEQPEVDLDKEILKYFIEIRVKDDETPILCDFKFKVNFDTIAHHFYELGLNAKEEAK